MAERIPARLSPAEGRRFALTVGLAFLVLAGISAWRGHILPPRILGSLGALLLIAGLVIPGQLGPVYRAWMGLAHALSKVTTPIFLGVVYFIVLTPIALLARLMGRHPMRHDSKEGSYWTPMSSGGRSNLETQF
jgi:hypothetical protein